MTGSGATPVRRIGAAAVAATSGLIVGATAAAVLGTVKVLLNPGLEITPNPGPMFVLPLMLMAEGLFWALVGGGMYVLPPAALVLAWFQPRDTRTTALALSTLLFVPVAYVGFRTRWVDALLLMLPFWFGVRVGLRVFSKVIGRI